MAWKTFTSPSSSGRGKSRAETVGKDRDPDSGMRAGREGSGRQPRRAMASRAEGLADDWTWNLSKRNSYKYLYLPAQWTYQERSLWLWLLSKSNSSSLSALPRHHSHCPLWAALFPHPQPSLDPFSCSCLSECAWPSLPHPPVTALICFQANCFYWHVQTNHLWEMPQDVNFIWNWVTAKSASFFYYIE